MPSVLVVDDDGNIRTAVSRLLERRGYECVLCESAEAAAGVLADRAVDALLLDLGLPGMDGLSFLRQLRRDRGRVPVVIMTGGATLSDAITAVRLRVSDFLQKPFADDELADAVATAVREGVSQSGCDLPALAAAAAPVAAPLLPAVAPAPSSLETRQAVQAVLAAMKDVDRRMALGGCELPALDGRVTRLQALMHRSVCGVEEVLDVVGADQALAATCLRAANSSGNGASQPIRNLRQACIQLGNRRVMAFASEALVQNAFEASREPFGSILARLWRNAIVTARVAQQLARYAHRASALARDTLPGLDELHVAALLHNLGELLLLRLLAQVQDFDVPDATTLAVLGEAVHARHESFGGKLARRWGLPKLVCGLAGAHHRPAHIRESGGEALVRNLVLAAWAMALRGGHAYLPAPPAPDPAEHLAAIGVEPAQVEPLYEQMDGWLTDLA